MFKKITLLSGVLLLSGFTVYNVFSNVGKVEAATPCVVTIFGKQYDVGPLQTGHSGGNVFTCGTDMTNVYQGMHGTNVSKISAYLIATPTVVPTVAPTVTPVPSVAPTGTPTVTPVPSVTTIPSPSVSPAPHHEDDDHDEIEIEDEENEVEHDEDHDDDHDDDRHRGKSQEQASEQGITSRNEHSRHHDD